MISLLLDLLLDILNEMLSLTLKSILPTLIECGNTENQIGIHLISIFALRHHTSVHVHSHSLVIHLHSLSDFHILLQQALKASMNDA